MPGLPPLDIEPPSRTARVGWLIGVLAVGGTVGLALPLALGERYDRGDFAGIVAYLALVGLPAALLVPIMLRAQRRKRRQLVARAGPGAVFASIGRALEVESVDHPKRLKRFADWSSGVLVVGTHGVSFTHARPSQTFDETRLTWSDIERATCARENPVRAFLRVFTATGQVHAWRVAGAADLEAALRRLQASDP